MQFSSMGKIPATIITGFLGSGKTTIIRALLEKAEGRRIALIINEFGDLGIDGGLLRGCGFKNCRDEYMVELNNGCICCTVAEDFIPAMTKLLACEPRPDYIIIETSGLALPQPLVAAFNWPAIKTQVTVDGVIAVIDAPAVLAGQFAENPGNIDRQRRSDENLSHETPLSELFEDQIQAADLIILNKADALNAAELAKARAAVETENKRGAPILESSFGNIGADILLGLESAGEDDIHNRPSQHEREHTQENQEAGAGHHHSHDEFTNFAIKLGAVKNVKAFTAALKAIIAKYGILRLKGFIDAEGKPMRCVAQAAGQRVDSYFDRAWGADEPRRTELVIIGLRDLDKQAVEREIRQAAEA